MALVFCTRCQNEYDNHTSTCPYCGNLTPPHTRLKGVFVIAIIAVVVAVTFAIPSLIASWQTQQNASAPDRTGHSVVTSATDSASSVAVSMPQPNQGDTTSTALTRYAERVNQSFEQMSLSSTITHLPADPQFDQGSQTFVHQINKQATLEIKLDSRGSQIMAVYIYNNNVKAQPRLMSNVAAAAFKSVLADDMDIGEVRDQITYLDQLAQSARNCTAAYQFEDFYLFETLDKAQNSSVVGLSSERPQNICR
jgi:hypothetical protein